MSLFAFTKVYAQGTAYKYRIAQSCTHRTYLYTAYPLYTFYAQSAVINK